MHLNSKDWEGSEWLEWLDGHMQGRSGGKDCGMVYGVKDKGKDRGKVRQG